MYQEIRKINKTNIVTVEKLYNLGKENMGTTSTGHESVNCDFDVLNVAKNRETKEYEKYYAPVKRVIRHKVSKEKWVIGDSNNEVIITNDHSIMILRDGVLQKIKPYEINPDEDFLISIEDGEVKITDIKRCERIGNFENEYVYDIEMNDETHTFVANDILVHNSQYSTFQEVIPTTDWFDHPVWRLTKINKQNDQKEFTYVSSGGYSSEDDAKTYFDTSSIDTSKFEWNIDQIDPAGREFCLTFNRVFLNDFFVKIFDKYAEKNGTPNILNFELEAYNESGIWLAKKKYIKNMTWSEPNVYYDSCTKIKATGVEIAQTSSSPWVKKQLTDLVTWIFQQEEFVLDSFVKRVETVKNQFMLQNPEIISVNKAMNKYSEYILNDTDEIEMNPKAMVTCQGAALYNYILNNNDKYKKRYSVLFDSDKLCVLYIKPTQKYTYWKRENQVPVKDVYKNPDMYKIISDKKQQTRFGDVYTDIMSLNMCDSFSYPAGMYPMDMSANFEIDRDRMFELLILGPINRIIEAMGYPPIEINMTCETGLW